MNVEPYDDKDGYRVWLSRDELDTLVNQYDDSEKRIAIQLGAYCGLRSREVVGVAPEHVVETDAGPMVRVFNSKGREYRETPIPQQLATQIWTIDDVRDAPSSKPVVDVSTRTLRRWVEEGRGQLVDEDDMWGYVGFHDLRRTWANQMYSWDVDMALVCTWGGWEDLETFLDHYKGAKTPEAQLREREKTEWL